MCLAKYLPSHSPLYPTNQLPSVILTGLSRLHESHLHVSSVVPHPAVPVKANGKWGFPKVDLYFQPYRLQGDRPSTPAISHCLVICRGSANQKLQRNFQGISKDGESVKFDDNLGSVLDIDAGIGEIIVDLLVDTRPDWGPAELLRAHLLLDSIFTCSYLSLPYQSFPDSKVYS
jgi:hypothetical protein